MSTLKKITKARYFWPLAALALILLINLFVSPDFFSFQIKEGHLYGRIIDILKNGTYLMVLSVGMTMVIATGGVDISVGSIIAISGAVACSIVDGRLGIFDGNMVMAIILALVAGIIFGAWNGFLVAKLKIQPMVATLILLVAGRGIAQLITNGKIVNINSDPYYFISSGYVLGLPFAIIVIAVLAIAVILFTKRTSFGLFLECVGINRKSSKFVGINEMQITWFVYIFSGFCAAIAGIFVSSSIKAADCNNGGLYSEMDAILAVALGGNIMSGGKFSIQASLIGALIIQSIDTSIKSMSLPPELVQLVKAIVVIIICLFQSRKFRAATVGRFSRRKAVEA